MLSKEEHEKQLQELEELLKEPQEIERISENSVIQEFYERFVNGNLSDREYLNLRKEIVNYMKNEGTKEDEDALQEFMECLVMICDAIEEGY